MYFGLNPAGMDASHMQLWDVSYSVYFREISKRADLQISKTSPGRIIKDVSSKRYLRSLRFFQRRLWVASETVIPGLQTKALFIQGMATYSSAYKSASFFAKLIKYRKVFRACFKPKIYLGYLYKRKKLF